MHRNALNANSSKYSGERGLKESALGRPSAQKVLPGSETFVIHECTSQSSAESQPRPFEQRRIEVSIRVVRSHTVTLSSSSHYLLIHSFTPHNHTHSLRLMTWRTLRPFLGSPRGGSEIGSRKMVGKNRYEQGRRDA